MRAGVIGCGVGGMAAALVLSRRGWQVTLLEEFATPKPVGSGILLQPTGLKALRTLGLEEGALASGKPVYALDGRDRQDRRVLDVRYARWREGAFGFGIHRAALFDLLFQAVREADIELITGTSIETVEDIDRPAVRAGDGRRFGSFDLLVVADGSSSSLRPQLRPNARAPVSAWGAVWANARDEAGAFDGVLGQVYEQAHTMVGVLPIGRSPEGETNMVSLFWSLPTAEMDAFFAASFEAWQARVTDCWPKTAALVAQLQGFGDLTRATYRDVQVGAWNAGACVLIGDAAHGTSPQLGQGANFALMDAVELAEIAPRTEADVHQALDRYQAARRRHVSLYSLASRWLTPLFQSHGALRSAFRDWAYTPASLAPVGRNLAAGMLCGAVRLGPWPACTRP